MADAEVNNDPPLPPSKFLARFRAQTTYLGWDRVRELATSRLPYALFGPTVITHFPLFRASTEDANFKNYIDHLAKRLPDELNTRFADEKVATLPYDFKKDAPPPIFSSGHNWTSGRLVSRL